MRQLSVIVPVYNEEDNLVHLHDRLAEVAGRLAAWDLEIVFVDDHSTDRSAEILAGLGARDPRIRTIRLSRNFGSHAAIRAGLDRCAGQAACVLAADLQDPPELIPPLLEKLEQGHDVVWACRESHAGPALRALFSRLYYRLMRILALPEIWPRGADVFVANRRVVDAVASIREKNTNLFALVLWAGFRQARISYRPVPRRAGSSKWGLGKSVTLVVDSLVSFSLFPIRLVSLTGLSLLLGGGAWALLSILTGLTSGHRPSGSAALLLVVLLLSGLHLTMLGIVAEVLWRTFDEARGRPMYIVEETKGFPAGDPSGRAGDGVGSRK